MLPQSVSSPGSIGSSLSIADALDRFYRARSVRWCPEYRSVVARLIRAWLGLLPPGPLEKISSIHIEGLYVARNDGTRGGFALNLERKILRSFFVWATKHKVIQEDPTFAWPITPEVIERLYFSIPPTMEAHIIHVLDPPSGSGIKWDPRVTRLKRLALIKFFVLGIRLGLRKGIICAAIWAWISIDWVFTVPAKFMKNRKPLRLPMPTRVIEILAPRGNPDDPLIRDLPPKGSINNLFIQIAKKAGIDPKILYPHQVRRTMVGRLLEAGVPESSIQKLGQWYQAEVMKKFYTCGLTDRVAREILEKI